LRKILFALRFAVYNKVLHHNDIPFVRELFDCLRRKQVEVVLYRPFAESLVEWLPLPEPVQQFETHEDFARLQCDFFVSLGGDGTILDSMTIVRDSKVPIVGVNLGRLGFLANVEKPTMLASIEALLQGSYQLDARSLLHLESNRPLFGSFNFALNDCTILKRDTSSMVIIHTFINGEFLNSYWADGIIVATPTGSSGYSLSCGGPIVFPNSDNFIITPVAPHNLNVRPIVISDASVISFEVEGRGRNFLCTLDSRYETIEGNDQLAVRKADFMAYLVRFPGRNFLKTIRDKLSWGADIRN
jgi:NAD+ kinase